MLVKDPKMDIFNLAQKMFPPITPDIFFGDKINVYKKSKYLYNVEAETDCKLFLE